MNQYALYEIKEVGKCVKNVILNEIQKISKNQYVVRDNTHSFSKQFLMHRIIKNRFENIS